jgi:hypothetical protein
MVTVDIKSLALGPRRVGPNIAIIAGAGVDVDPLLCPPTFVRLSLLPLCPLELMIGFFPLLSLLSGEYIDASKRLKGGDVMDVTTPYEVASRMLRSQQEGLQKREEIYSIEVGLR